MAYAPAATCLVPAVRQKDWDLFSLDEEGEIFTPVTARAPEMVPAAERWLR